MLKEHWFAFWASFLWQTKCNKIKSRMQRMCHELHSRISWKKDPIDQAIRSSIKDFFNTPLNETKGFKYQITLKVVLKKYLSNGEFQFAPIYFNSTTKIVISHRFSLENAFQEILYRTDDWINKESGWIVELIECQYITFSTYRPLSRSFYIRFPA